MKNKILFILISVFTLALPGPQTRLCGQVVQAWVQTDGGSAEDQATAIAVDASGNVYVTGWSTGFGTGYDYLTIKYNTFGVPQWGQRYIGPGNGNDMAFAIAVDASGNVYVTGSSLGDGTGDDYATIKYNSSGVLQWVQRYNGPGNSNDVGRSVGVDALGYVYVTGTDVGSGPGTDIATLQYNSSGTPQWVQRYDGPASDNDQVAFRRTMIVDASGNVYLTGGSDGVGSNFDFVTIKYSSAGLQQWVQRYNGPGNSNDIGERIAIDGSGNVYVTGVSYGSGTNFDYATIKYNSSGVQQWLQRYDGPASGSDDPLGIVTDNQGNVYVTGYSAGSGTDYDYATIKYNSSGVQQWVQRYNGPGNGSDRAWSIAIDGLGNVYVTGESYGFGCLTLKYNSSGAQQWLQAYVGTANVGSGVDIKVDGSGSVYVTGFGSNIGTGLDYATIKYVQTPYIVFLALPADNAFVNPNLGLSWHSILNAQYYRLQVARDSSFNDLFLDLPDLADTSRMIDGLNYTTPYWWRVRAINGAGPGPWSDVRKFTTLPENPIPFIIDKINLLKEDVDELVSSGNLRRIFGILLNHNLRGASNQLSQGHPNIAIIKMQLFKFEVNILINHNFLSEQLGQPLITSADEIISLIQNLNGDNNNTHTENEVYSFSLKQNYPNPFNPKTNISFTVSKAGLVKLIVYDITGREVTTLINKVMAPGTYTSEFDASTLASGVYFYKLVAGEYTEIKKMVLIK